MDWKTFYETESLPDSWDSLAGENIFLKKEFLRHLEKVNPCSQSYNLLADKSGKLLAIYVDYAFKLDIFTYSSLSLKLPIRIMGIPCSVSKQGFSVTTGYENYLLEHFQRKKGSKLILNCVQELPGKLGLTLPTCRVDLKWKSFSDYLSSMRSNYRYRISKALKKWQGVRVEVGPIDEFDEEMYSLYEGVYAKSQAKLEKLSYGFFQNLPATARIIKATHNSDLLGYCILLDNQEELIFLFTGFSYQDNKQFDTYFNLLLEIMKFGIANNFKVIDLGQTAEETKMKLGGKLFKRGMYISHSNGLINWLANRALSILSYKEPTIHYQVFKNED